MNIQWIVFASILLLNTAAALVVAALLARRPSAPGLWFLVWILTMLAVWTFSYAMLTLLSSLAAKHFWLKVENIGIVSVPVLWFFFTLQYTALDKWLTRSAIALFWIIPLVTLILLFSEHWFHLYYSFTRPVSEAGGPLVIGRGPWYSVQLVQSYLLDLIGIILLAQRFIQHRNIYRRQTITLLGAVLIPFLVNVFYQLAPRIAPSISTPIDLTPLSFTVTAALLGAGIFGWRLFDLMPITRHKVLDYIPEMVVVVDPHDRVLDANQTAQEWLGKTLDEIVGKDPIEIFHGWTELINRFLTANETHEEIQVPGDPPRTLELTVSALYNQSGDLEGRVIVAHDITFHKWLENDMKYANEALIRQLDEIEQLRADLEEQAIRDPLTNVYNRRYMAEFLDKEIARAEREKTPVSLVIMDMDNFKQFNDSYGHKCGDIVLQAFANFLLEHTRRGDVVCRYGGEEFVILMPNAPLEIGYERAETWRQDFSETPIEYEGMKFSATFSAGVATFPQHGFTGDSILQAADKALYRSKNGGRNRVTAFAK